MLEVAKLIVTTLVRQIDVGKIFAFRKSNKQADFGYGIFQLYVELANIYSAGGALIDEIERVVSLSKKSSTKEIKSPLRAMVRRQLAAVRGCVASFNQVHQQTLLLLHPSIFQDLDRDVKEKEKRFRALQSDLKQATIKESELSDFYFERSIGTYSLKAEDDDIGPMGMLKAKFGDTDSISPNNIRVLKAYLKEHKPRRRLAEIKNEIDRLHKAIIKNFKVKDILLKIEGVNSRKNKPTKSKPAMKWLPIDSFSVLPRRLPANLRKLR